MKAESTSNSEYEEVNVGSQEDPRLIKVGKILNSQERKEFIDLDRESRDVFACSYNELKTYDKDIIQHVIPLEENVKPHRHKLRKVNPKLAPLGKKELENMVEENDRSPNKIFIVSFQSSSIQEENR